MMIMTKEGGVEAKAGDVFLIPVSGSSYGMGQVVARYGEELYLVVYEVLTSREAATPELVLDEEPVLASLSLDAKLWHGHWPIIGNTTKNLTKISEPAFKINVGGAVLIESQDRSKNKEADPEQVDKLRYRTTVAPVRLENAIRALHTGVGWNAAYDRLSYRYALETSRLLA